MKGGMQVIRRIVKKQNALGALVVFMCCIANTANAQIAAAFTDPHQALQKAEQLADIYNWYDAHQYFVEAERLFLVRGDERNALFARASRLRGEMQIRPFPDVVDAIDEILSTAATRSDPALRLRCLIVRGDVNLEIDAPAAKDDWEAALEIAKTIGDRKWESRAIGELGMIAFLLGDASAARLQVGQALMNAMTTGDVGSQIRYHAAIATGLHLSQEYEQAIRYFDLALNLSAKHPETGFQYISYWGKAKALMGLKRFQEAEDLIRDSLRQAEADDRRVKKVQMLLAASDLARTLGKRDEALAYLQEALPIAEQGGLRRFLAEIYFDLADICQRANNIADAEAFASRAVTISEEVGVPSFSLRNSWCWPTSSKLKGGGTKRLKSSSARPTSWKGSLLTFRLPTMQHADTSDVEDLRKALRTRRD